MESSMPHLAPADQAQIAPIAEVAAKRLQWFGFMQPKYQPLTIETRLEVVRALYYMRSFRAHVEPFIQDEPRVTAFEDAVIAAVVDLIAGQVNHV